MLQQAIDGSLDSQLFTPAAWTEVSRSAAAVNGFLKSLGPVNSVELISRADVDGGRLSRYRLIFKDNVLLFSMVLNHTGKIAALRLQPE